MDWIRLSNLILIFFMDDFVVGLLGGFDTAHAAARLVLCSIRINWWCGFVGCYKRILTCFFFFIKFLGLMIELQSSSGELKQILISI